MTNVEYIQRLLDDARLRHGEDAYSTRILKEQLRSMKDQPQSAAAMFLVGSRARNHARREDGTRRTWGELKLARRAGKYQQGKAERPLDREASIEAIFERVRVLINNPASGWRPSSHDATPLVLAIPGRFSC